MMNNTQLKILNLLLEEGEDVSIREVARRLRISSALAHYHMKKLSKMGVLIHRSTSPQAGYYELQAIFTENQEATLMMLRSVAEKVRGYTPDKLGNCISFFLKCINSEIL